MSHNKTIPFLLPGFMLLMLACTLVPALIPAPTATPTPPPSGTPQPSPTPTLLVHLTPPTPIPTATVLSSSPEYWSCQVRWQSPHNGVKLDPKEHFDAAWQVVNNGYGAWESDTVRFAYFSGRRLQVSDFVPLNDVIAPDTRTQLIVPMVAPRSSGRYSTVWALWNGDNDFCHMTLTIVVR